MIFENLVLDIFILFLPILVLSIIQYRVFREDMGFIGSFFFYFLPATIGFIGLYIMNFDHLIISFALYAIIIIFQILFILTEGLNLFKYELSDMQTNVLLFTSLLIGFMGMTVSSINYVSNYSSRSDQLNTINSNVVESKLKDLTNKFAEFQETVTKESNEIDLITNSILEEVKRKNSEIKKLEIQKEQIRNEINNFKNISNISTKEAESIISVLSKRESKVTEYLISFIIGVFSSFLVTYMFSRLSKMRKKASNIT
jgi:uncharacterized phage infection (PIP) family protein YhgE